MSRDSVRNNNWPLLMVLGVLTVLIVGLGIAYAFLKMNDINLIDRGYDSTENTTIMTSEEILNKVSSDNNYGYDQAAEDFRAAIAASEGLEKIALAYDFAEYDYLVFDDAERVVKIMEEEGDPGDDVFLKYSYYGRLLSIYREFGYTEKADEIQMKMDEITSKYFTSVKEDNE